LAQVISKTVPRQSFELMLTAKLTILTNKIKVSYAYYITTILDEFKITLFVTKS